MRGRWLLSSLLLVASGCFLVVDFEGYGESPRGDVLGEAGLIDASISGGFKLTIEPPRIVLRPGESREVVVKVESEGGFDATVALEAAAAGPLDSSAPGKALTEDQPSLVLTVSARADAVPGTTGSLVLTGTAGDRRSDVRLDVDIYGAAGTLDTTFGNGGIVAAELGTQGSVGDMAIDGDDRIVVGLAAPVPDAFVVARLTRNGALDTAFANGGIAAVPELDGANTHADAIALAPDGVLAAGASGVTVSVARFTDTGARAPAFGVNGLARIDDTLSVLGLFVRGSGHVLLGGARAGNPGLLQLVPGGTVDESFAVGGRAQFAKSNADTASIARMPDEGVIGVAAVSVGTVGSGFGWFAFEPNGKARPPASIEVAGSGKAIQVASAPTGESVAVGHTATSGDVAGVPDTAFIQLRQADGGVSAYGGGGLVAVEVPGKNTMAHAATFDASGRLVVALSTSTDGEPTTLLLARLQPNGTFDEAFGGSGRVAPNVALTPSRIGTQKDGRIVVAGVIPTDGGWSVAVARFWP